MATLLPKTQVSCSVLASRTVFFAGISVHNYRRSQPRLFTFLSIVELVGIHVKIAISGYNPLFLSVILISYSSIRCHSSGRLARASSSRNISPSSGSHGSPGHITASSAPPEGVAYLVSTHPPTQFSALKRRSSPVNPQLLKPDHHAHQESTGSQEAQATMVGLEVRAVKHLGEPHVARVTCDRHAHTFTSTHAPLPSQP